MSEYQPHNTHLEQESQAPDCIGALVSLVVSSWLQESVGASDLSSQPVQPAYASKAPAAPEDSPAALLEKRGYVRSVPKFSELLADGSRTNTFKYDGHEDDDEGESTEHEGLLELKAFLDVVTGCSDVDTGEAAADMIENLTFIGKKEYDEGVIGLATYWKNFLDSDPEAQICPVTNITPLFAETDKIKSDKYLLECILGQFTDEELEKYAGRLVLDHSLLTAPSEKVRVVLLDDWTISGSQMRDAYTAISGALTYEYEDRIEINLLVASPRWVSNGLAYNGLALPIKAYFVAHDAKAPVGYPENGSYISGTHSSVDYDFAETLEEMLEFAPDETAPRLARINRGYGTTTPRADRLAQLYASA